VGFLVLGLTFIVLAAGTASAPGTGNLPLIFMLLGVIFCVAARFVGWGRRGS
jgi:hypothetical protein